MSEAVTDPHPPRFPRWGRRVGAFDLAHQGYVGQQETVQVAVAEPGHITQFHGIATLSGPVDPVA